MSRWRGRTGGALLFACGSGCASVAALAGCGQILGLGSLHARSEDGGELGGDASVADTGAPYDAATDTGSSSEAGSGTDSASGEAGAEGGCACATGSCAGGACTGTTTSAPSCQPGGAGRTNCGPGGTGNESCCASIEVAGGTYSRTYDPPGPDGGVALSADGGPTGESDPATVSGFRLDKYLVTVGRFREFVNAVLPPDGGAGWLPPQSSGKHAHLNAKNGLSATGGGYEPGWDKADDINVAPTNANLACDASYATWTANGIGTGNNSENLPINCVNWWESYAFCIWDDGFLPSEAEWEYAAAGGSQQREYPWGGAAPGLPYAIYSDDYPGTGTCVGTGCIAPVGTPALGAGVWGQLDLAGEVFEWNVDWYSATYALPCADCASFSKSSDRVGRGGSFAAGPSYLRPPTRGFAAPGGRKAGIGFRCARVP